LKKLNLGIINRKHAEDNQKENIKLEHLISIEHQFSKINNLCQQPFSNILIILIILNIQINK